MTARSVWLDWRRKVHDILEVGGAAYPAAYAFNAFIVTLIILNAIAFAAETVDHVAERYEAEFAAFNLFTVFVFTVEYVLRVWSAVEIPMLSRLPPWKARLKFALRPMMLIDLLAFAPWYLQWIFPIDLRVLRVLRLFRLLRLVRYSPALQTMGRVLADEYRALLGALLVMLVLLLFASTGIYFLEREAQPDKFDSIPAAAWWALATLTTVGYGDVVPVTPFGKMLGGVVMLLGVGMFALPIAIVAAGFSQESSRHQFVVTWGMVSRVPLFATMNEAEIAEITKLIYARTYLPGVPIVRAGDRGEAMFLIESGEAEVRLGGGKSATLKSGDFFGERALLERRRNQHDVVAMTRCRVYVLDSQALARLNHRHPEILDRIREVAAARREADAALNKDAPKRRARRATKQSEKI
ncbi:cyclic nucleotide-gated ion channel [Methyloceanibacter sp.]|uniref:cyclic nucleotide-gated ion channel n=1 Tax=Methyloceanibacter sp. TaxID=1965321 RepID=UPI003D6D0627